MQSFLAGLNLMSGDQSPPWQNSLTEKRLNLMNGMRPDYRLLEFKISTMRWPHSIIVPSKSMTDS